MCVEFYDRRITVAKRGSQVITLDGMVAALRAETEPLKARIAQLEAALRKPKEMTMRKVSHCENCGADLGGPVERYANEMVTCGARECEREARDQEVMQRDAAHEQLDRDMGYEHF